ncbi:MAG: hypothetical protein GOVbin1678_16 [Prokaryotic dsDNA virus sp.]|jgi:cell fate (sporulation/competence/biofilm development) regulator YmcA (YheA/YmcA/DUF963 family)|nr:MAG: hypothetical protein GOVbin1678_16 [Prokaryotic dsDNA virus sp.]|tara:strand:- start:9501 stop:9731 length:231 start_codon:yes stop_codon:yes gene_type:complete
MKKLTKEELQSLQKSIKDYNAIKLKLAETVLHQQAIMGEIGMLKSQFLQQEKVLMDKYGKDSSINTQTGEVTKIKK